MLFKDPKEWNQQAKSSPVYERLKSQSHLKFISHRSILIGNIGIMALAVLSCTALYFNRLFSFVILDILFAIVLLVVLFMSWIIPMNTGAEMFMKNNREQISMTMLDFHAIAGPYRLQVFHNVFVTCFIGLLCHAMFNIYMPMNVKSNMQRALSILALFSYALNVPAVIGMLGIGLFHYFIDSSVWKSLIIHPQQRRIIIVMGLLGLLLVTGLVFSPLIIAMFVFIKYNPSTIVRITSIGIWALIAIGVYFSLLYLARKNYHFCESHFASINSNQ